MMYKFTSGMSLNDLLRRPFLFLGPFCLRFGIPVDTHLPETTSTTAKLDFPTGVGRVTRVGFMGGGAEVCIK